MSSSLAGLRTLLAATFAFALLLGLTPVRAADVEPAADRVLRDMGNYLTQGTQFSLQVEELYDAVLELGPIVQMRATAKVAVRRPDRLRVIKRGDSEDQDLWYDGKQFTLLDVRRGQYGTVEVPPTLDSALDHLAEKYGLTFTLSDLVYPDVYNVLIENVRTGLYLGRSSVRGVSAHHLLFVQEDIDWQLWVADAFASVPLKVVINFKKEPGNPRFMAWLFDWDFSPRLADDVFQFAPPSGSESVDFVEMVGRRVRSHEQ